jgi:O-antigen ligase
MRASDGQSPASFLVAGVCLAVPLLILPAYLSFSFDSLPKAVYLCLSAALFLLIPGALARCAGGLLTTSAGKLFLAFVLIASVSLMVSSFVSIDPKLSLFGARWRYFGALSQIAVLALGIAVAGCFSASQAALFFSLRMLSVAGLLAALYALLQLFGFDPLLDPHLYTLATAMHVTRPPASLGHPGYLAGFETMVFFVALALLRREERRVGRVWLVTCAGLALVAILISGTRAAMLAVVLCFPVFLTIPRARVLAGRTPAALFLASAGLFGLLVLAPQGEGLRQRLRQSTEDFGGPRLLLWRDTVPLIESRVLAGSGPETFTAAFPRFESRELYLRYPDFQQESPHNIFLDALVGQGIPGFIQLLFACALAGWCAWKAEEKNRDIANILFGAVLACVIFHQFFVFTISTYWVFVLLIAALVALSAPVGRSAPGLTGLARAAFAISGALLGIVLLVSAIQLGVTDHAFARIDSQLKQGDLAGAVQQYHRALRWKVAGDAPDLWYSQQMAWAAQVLPAGESQQLARAEALESSRIACEDPGEDGVAASYHRAILCASTGRQLEAEKIARRMCAQAPNWYQSHWILSRLLVGRGSLQEGRREAELALALVGDARQQVRQRINSYEQALLLLEKNKSFK